MEERQIPATLERMGGLAAFAGLDPDRFISRVKGTRTGHVGYLDGLARVLDLSEPEKVRLAMAYALERRS